MTTIVMQAQFLTIGSGYASSCHVPVKPNYKYSFSEQIYTASEIGSAGTFYSLGFYNNGSDPQTRTLDVYVAFTDKNEFINMTEDDKVFSGEVTFAKDEWTTITFDKPLEYDGTQNMIIAVNDLTPDQDGEAILHGSGSKRGSKARRGKPGGDLSGFVYVPVKERLVCTDRSTGEYRLTFTVPHSAKQVRILVSTFGEQGADEIEIKSARGGAGAGNEVSHKGNELLLTSVEKDASATVTFVTGFPHYCMMGADYYEAN